MVDSEEQRCLRFNGKRLFYTFKKQFMNKYSKQSLDIAWPYFNIKKNIDLKLFEMLFIFSVEENITEI